MSLIGGGGAKNAPPISHDTVHQWLKHLRAGMTSAETQDEPLLESEDLGQGVVGGGILRRRLQGSSVQTLRLVQFPRSGPQPPQQDQSRRVRRGRGESPPEHRLCFFELAILSENGVCRLHGMVCIIRFELWGCLQGACSIGSEACS